MNDKIFSIIEKWDDNISYKTPIIMSFQDDNNVHLSTLCPNFKIFSSSCLSDIDDCNFCDTCVKTLQNNVGAGIILDNGANFFFLRDRVKVNVSPPFNGLNLITLAPEVVAIQLGHVIEIYDDKIKVLKPLKLEDISTEKEKESKYSIIFFNKYTYPKEKTIVKNFTADTLENARIKFLELVNDELCSLEAIDEPVLSIDDIDYQAIINYVDDYEEFKLDSDNFLLKTSDWKTEIKILKNS